MKHLLFSFLLEYDVCIFFFFPLGKIVERIWIRLGHTPLLSSIKKVLIFLSLMCVCLFQIKNKKGPKEISAWNDEINFNLFLFVSFVFPT